MADKVISTYTQSTTLSTTSWFLFQNGDSTYFKFDLYTYLRTQSTWINVTYSSSWTDYSTSYHPTSYYKDILGLVHLRIGASGGASVPIANLPAGFVPQYNLRFPAFSPVASSSLNPNITITSTGGINPSAYTTYIISEEIIFTPST